MKKIVVVRDLVLENRKIQDTFKKRLNEGFFDNVLKKVGMGEPEKVKEKKVSTMTPKEKELYDKAIAAAGTAAEAQKDFMYRSKYLKEGTYNNDREIAIYDGEDGLTYIEKTAAGGYYGWNDEFDFDAPDKKELERKLKSWKYKLISGSIDEKTIRIDWEDDENSFIIAN